MTLYSYIVASDHGFAPNPFHGVCTVACCKPAIRRTAKVGDYIVGLARRHLGNTVVYAMKVDEILEFDDYWLDERFHAKRPDRSAGGIAVVGDNIYHTNESGEWQQERSRHTFRHIDHDLRGQYVLIGHDFIYWGGDGPPLPANLTGLIARRGHKSKANDRLIPDFVEWFAGIEERGLLGWPSGGPLAT